MQRTTWAVWLLIGAVTSIQFGAGFAKTLFAQVPPLTVAWLRLTFAAMILWTFVRPKVQGRSRSEWRDGLAYIAALLLMNITIYLAFERIPLGIAVTLEFLGPLAVALVGSRRWTDGLWVLLAGTGVVLLGWRPVPLDAVGVIFALVAGAGWAGYLVMGRRAGRSWDALTVLTLACTAGAVGLAVPAIMMAGGSLWHWVVLGTGLAVGLMSTVIPYPMEFIAMRHLPTKVMGVLASLDPAVAALAGVVILREALSGRDVVAIVAIMAASVGVLWTRQQAVEDGV